MNKFPSNEFTGALRIFILGDLTSVIFGKFTDLNVWNSTLPIKQIADMSKALNVETQPFLQWSDVKLDLLNFEEAYESEEDLFSEDPENLFLFKQRTFYRGYSYCKNIGGEIATPHENVKMETWKYFILKENVGRIYLGYSDRKRTKNDFRHVYTGSPAKWLNWEPGQPNDWGGYEDCVVVYKDNVMRDDNCETENDVVCVVKGFQHFMLRGVCITSPVDSFYVLGEAGHLTGYTQTSMSLSEDGTRWEIWHSYNTSLLLAYTNYSEFPVGIHSWYFEAIGGQSECEGTSRDLLLHLSVEQPGTWCCGDGACISSELRCDNNQHCHDRSVTISRVFECGYVGLILQDQVEMLSNCCCL